MPDGSLEIGMPAEAKDLASIIIIIIIIINILHAVGPIIQSLLLPASYRPHILPVIKEHE